MISDNGNNEPDEIFDYRSTKEGKVFISWRGRDVIALKDKEAAKFILKIKSLNNTEAQLLMAKATGNFKRGNEK